jgi:hypothetical protein
VAGIKSSAEAGLKTAPIWGSRVGLTTISPGGVRNGLIPRLRMVAHPGGYPREHQRPRRSPLGAFFVYGDLTLRLGLNLLLLLGCWSSLLSGRRWRGRFGEIVRKPLPDLCHLE